MYLINNTKVMNDKSETDQYNFLMLKLNDS